MTSRQRDIAHKYTKFKLTTNCVSGNIKIKTSLYLGVNLSLCAEDAATSQDNMT